MTSNADPQGRDPELMEDLLADPIEDLEQGIRLDYELSSMISVYTRISYKYIRKVYIIKILSVLSAWIIISLFSFFKYSNYEFMMLSLVIGAASLLALVIIYELDKFDLKRKIIETQSMIKERKDGSIDLLYEIKSLQNVFYIEYSKDRSSRKDILLKYNNILLAYTSFIVDSKERALSKANYTVREHRNFSKI
ncbi:MAG TPA: hypothetical protein VK610_03070 [Rhodothermales bacterium]|nr:hypothetical protein [Rhodothermales bacterium]